MAQTTTPVEGPAPGRGSASWEGFRWRRVASVLGPIAWPSFTLLYVGFWAKGFTPFQSVILILVSMLVLGGVMGSIWATWGPRHRFRAEWWS